MTGDGYSLVEFSQAGHGVVRVHVHCGRAWMREKTCAMREEPTSTLAS